MFKDVAESVAKEKNQEGNEWTACLVKAFPEKKENEPFIKKKHDTYEEIKKGALPNTVLQGFPGFSSP